MSTYTAQSTAAEAAAVGQQSGVPAMPPSSDGDTGPSVDIDPQIDLSSRRCEDLATEVQVLLTEIADSLPFHGWSHTAFVTSKAAEFAARRGGDVELIEAAALVHDLNYVVGKNSHPRAGRDLRQRALTSCGFSLEEAERIDEIIEGAHTADRQPDADLDTQCLSDADTMYKSLPITPVLFAHRYLAENGIGLRQLAEKIVDEQASKLADGFYFYDDDLKRRYGSWAETNLSLWRTILEALDDDDVSHLVALEQAS